MKKRKDIRDVGQAINNPAKRTIKISSSAKAKAKRRTKEKDEPRRDKALPNTKEKDSFTFRARPSKEQLESANAKEEERGTWEMPLWTDLEPGQVIECPTTGVCLSRDDDDEDPNIYWSTSNPTKREKESGRFPKLFAVREIEKRLMYFCTDEEFCTQVTPHMTVQTLGALKKCPNFLQFFSACKANATGSLRRSQYLAGRGAPTIKTIKVTVDADGNETTETIIQHGLAPNVQMLIHLGKHHLGQHDVIHNDMMFDINHLREKRKQSDERDIKLDKNKHLTGRKR